jgi:hypothetical protein
MSRLGLMVPPTIIISTESSISFHESKKISSCIIREYKAALKDMEKTCHKRFGSMHDIPPLILCLRAGAPLPISSYVGMNNLPDYLVDNKRELFGFTRGFPERLGAGHNVLTRRQTSTI